MPSDVEVDPYPYQGRAAGVLQTRFHGKVCSTAVSKDGGGVAGEVEDGS